MDTKAFLLNLPARKIEDIGFQVLTRGGLTDDERENLLILSNVLFPKDPDTTLTFEEAEPVDWIFAMITRQWDWFERILGLQIMSEEFSQLEDAAWDYIYKVIKDKKFNDIGEWIKFVLKVLGQRWSGLDWVFEDNCFRQVEYLRKASPHFDTFYYRCRDLGILEFSWDKLGEKKQNVVNLELIKL